MKVLAIIPARGGSKGIKNKNMVRLNGRPLIFYTLKAALESKKIDRVVVSSDDKDILDYAARYCETIKRPYNLSKDDSSTESVMDHVLEELEKDDYEPHIIVLLQPTSPMRTAKDIDEALGKLKSQFKSVISITEKHHHFNWKKLPKMEVSPKNYEIDKRPMRQDLDEEYEENGAIYITRRVHYEGVRLEPPIYGYVMPKWRSFEIDDMEDLKCIEKLMKK